MLDRIPVYLVTLPNFLLYFAASLVLTALFLGVYILITPHREFRLIRAGNNAAAIALSGALLGFVLPLASTIANSLTLLDMVVWGFVAMIVQILVYLAARLLKPELSRSIADGNAAPAVWLAGLAVAVGILNAACMTY